MAPAGKIYGFHRDGNDWFSDASLPSDITLVVDDMKFHLHKFPLVSRCGRIAKFVEEYQITCDNICKVLEEFPGGADTFFTIVEFCYGGRVEFTPKNVVMLYCAADYLEMTDYFDEDNLLPKAESFFHRHILRKWKDCILALQSCEPVIARANKLHIISRCSNALSVMVCTDPSLFGWPMMMYGKTQSPGGSILWNGINTGARIYSAESDWWFEDVSCLSVELFKRLIRTMEIKGIRAGNLASAIMYYCTKYLPGLDRWHGGHKGKFRKTGSFSLTRATVDQSVLLRNVVKLLPEKKGRSFCRFLVGLLRVALILGVNHTCQDALEKKIGAQLELATLDGLLIPSYSDSDTLYNTDCVERMIRHFVHSEPSVTSISPSSRRLKRVGKLVDNYIAEVASDINLKPGKIQSLAEALPDSFRSLHDGLYRALDIYFKTHPWLSEKEKLQLCGIIDFRKLSIDACVHASQNERLPLRVILQVLFFEQMQLRTAIAAASAAAPSEMTSQIVWRDERITVVRENEVLKVDMARMRSRVGELEQEISKIKEGMNKVTKTHSYLSSPNIVAKGIGCKMLSWSSDAQPGLATPRVSVEQAQRSTGRARCRKSIVCSD